MSIETGERRLTCADGATLGATIYEPSRLKAAVMLGPATGIRRGFYRAFATWLASHGYGVITYDNRGVGDSLQASVSRCDASLVDWGRLDMPAVLEALQSAFPGTTYHLVGHSAGGLLAGLMPNARGLSSMFNVACSSGSLRNMRAGFRLQAEFFMNVFIPVTNALLGHTPAQWVGMGEPLPKRAAAEWRRWCNGRGYLATDFGRAIPDDNHLYDALTLPSLWLHASDDPIANLANVTEMVGVYSKSDARIVTLDPAAEGLRAIGHMAFFRHETLWGRTLGWLEKWADREIENG